MKNYKDTTLSIENLRQLLDAPMDVKLLAMRHYQEIARLNEELEERQQWDATLLDNIEAENGNNET